MMFRGMGGAVQRKLWSGFHWLVNVLGLIYLKPQLPPVARQQVSVRSLAIQYHNASHHPQPW